MPKNIIITGATSGIGFDLAKSLISNGDKVYVTGRNFEKFSTTIYKWCIDNGFEDLCIWVKYDFSNLSGISEEELKKIPEVFGYVNCAGVLPISPLKLHKANDIIKTININLASPIMFTRELLKSNRIAKGGAIVYISSINGTRVGSKAHTVYSATKGGIAGLVMSLANELSALGIRVNAVAPGTVASPMLEKTKKLIGEKSFSDYLGKYPLGIGSSDSLISLINFLLDENLSSWITGQNLVVDGGYTLN